MKDKFREIRLNNRNKQKLSIINSIIEEYSADGYRLTLRQLYYQLVSRDVIANAQKEYDKLSKLLKEGRMGGRVDWNAIEDRLRVPYVPYSNDDPEQAIEDAIAQYRLNRQEGQEVYIEVWVEKDALSGVLRRITSKYHVRLLVNRGYGSVTAIHDAYNRFVNAISTGQDCVILYLGDHDPSGMDMIRDIYDRINEMLEAKHFYGRLSVDSIALTMEQIKKYNPPPNPAKLTDPRAAWYIERHGHSSWEVDALNPKALNEILSSKIEYNMNMDLYKEVLKQEKKDKIILQSLADQIDD